MGLPGYDHPPLSDNLHQFCDASGSSLHQVLTMDEGFAFPDRQVISYSNINEDACHEDFVMNDGMLDFSVAEKFDQNLPHINDFYGQPQSQSVNGTSARKASMSTEEIMNLAGSHYMRAGDQAAYWAVPALPTEEQKSLELAHLLFSAAEMVGNKQYDQASRLLTQCRQLSSQFGKPTERLSYYFSEAMEERIGRETGDLKKPQGREPDFAYNIYCKFQKNEFYALVASYTKLIPFTKVLQFTSIQAILDAVGNSKKVNVIDLGLRTGSQWTVLIQSLAQRACNLELLKITAVGMNAEELKNSGRRLHAFAESLGVPFSFKMVEISNMKEINEGLLNVKSGEAVAVYAPIVLRSLLYDSVLLDNLMAVIKKLRPLIIVNSEIEGQHNSPSFVKRFIEVIFYFSSYFDMLETHLESNDPKRMKFEELFCGEQISNMIACEGKERTVRHVRTDIWRCFFKEVGFKEIGFSYQAWYQARLLLSQLPHEECFTLDHNGLAMTLGWKGTPFHAVSVWTCR